MRVGLSKTAVGMGDRVTNVECTKQDVIALSAIQSESYTLNTGGARTIYSNYLDRHRIERCMTKLGMMIVGAWGGEQLLVLLGTGVIIGEDLFEGHSWTTGVVLLITVGVGPLSCVCAVFNPHLPTGSVHATREPEVARQPRGMILRSMRTKIINHVKERTWSLSWYCGDQLWQLMDVECTVIVEIHWYSCCIALPS